MKFEKKLLMYAIGNVAAKFVSVALLPIYTRYLVPEDYGRADIANSAVILIVSIIFIEVWTALLRFLYEDQDKSKVFTNVVAVSLIFTIPYCLVQSITNIILKTDFIFISIVYGFTFLINNLYQFMARGKGKNDLFVISGIIASCTQGVAAIILIYWFKFGAEVILIAPSIGYFISILYLEVKSRFSKDIQWRLVDITYIKKIILFSIPLALNTSAFWLIANFNRYYIAYLMGFEYSSFVSISSKFTLVISLVASIYALVWQESAYENSSNNDRASYYSNMTRIYIALSAILTALCIPISKILFPIMIGRGYYEAKIILAPYFVATFLSGISTFLAQIFNAEKKTGLLMISTVTGSMTNVVLMLVFASKLGLFAAPISLGLGYIVNIVSRYINIRKFVELKLEMNVILKATSIITFGTITYYVLTNTLALLISTITLCIFIVVVYKDIIKFLIKRTKAYCK